ncbi:hypothetical protein LTR78_010862 [Recurvomyces mirabilis]|uniref:Luciferase-like domain-containing protein n=1 Tax=Recurvomyces mirabilis TaxID=574656 RepID=A0AAE0TLK8_9PEZI|nr:hypothetical protein LTR78_010862 [Recurvomyces mirabilis]
MLCVLIRRLACMLIRPKSTKSITKVDPSPQRTPFLLQAGASKAGQGFAAAHSECMFLPGMTPQKTRVIADEVRAKLREIGRPEGSVKFLKGVFICVDDTDEKVQAKFEDLLQYTDLEGTATLLGGWTGTDLSQFADDEDFSFKGPPASQSTINAWTSTVPGTASLKWTKRRVMQQLALCGTHPRAVGSANTVADLLEKWIEEAIVDGWNISHATTPHTFEDVIKFLWPELRRRRHLQIDYAGQSMRENYLQDGLAPRVRQGHPARVYGHA